MNQREVGELRRRFRPDKSAISRVYGCYVNTNKEIIACLDAPLGIMPQEEAEAYLDLLKKSLSGALGKNLIDIVFSTQQVMDSEEHRLLSALRASGLKDDGARQAFYEKVVNSLDMGDSNYLILLAHDAYDVPYRGKDDALLADASDTVFSYIVCAICPVKDGKVELGYFPGENAFHNFAIRQTVSAPELGFLFPAFDDRAANIYNALFYSHKTDDIHQDFIDAIFKTEPPMSAADQKAAFETALTDALEEDCSLEVVQAVHEQLAGKILQHKESRNPEPLELTPREIGGILRDCGVPEARTAAFQEKCGQQFGEGAALKPTNLINNGRFEVKTTQATISIDPAYSHLAETRVINGKPYLLIPIEDGIEVNGLPVSVSSQESDFQQSN